MLNEKKKLLETGSADLLATLEEHDAFIAGGAITSVFTNKPINDLDVYFRNKTTFTTALSEILGLDGGSSLSSSEVWMFNVTDKSLMLKSEGKLIQLICYRFFDNPSDLFNSYDFTINMGAYNLKNDSWEFHPDFFRHNAQRYLHFNAGTDYPIVSAMRVQKYKERGYNISKAQMLKIMLAISDLQLNSWLDFKDHVGGMYGLSVDDVFDTTQVFSKFEAIAQLDNLEIPTHVDTNGATVVEAVEKLSSRLDHRVLADLSVQFKKDNFGYPAWNNLIEQKYRPV